MVDKRAGGPPEPVTNIISLGSPQIDACESDADAFYAAYDSARRRRLLDLLGRVNVSALAAIASSIRHGMPCKVPALARDSEGGLLDAELASSQMGGQNCNVDIIFDDGAVWLARIRLDDPLLPPKEAQEYIFLSEVFTLKFLKNTKVPTPKVFHFASEGPENPVGVTFLIMEKMKGVPLEWQDATPAQKSKILEQLADIYLELEQHPFESTGSLIDSTGSAKVGAFAQPLLFDSPRCSLGPFNTFELSLEAIISQQMRLISNGEISPLAEDLYLTHCWRMRRVPTIVSYQKDTKFYLKHFDDKGDHILIDEEYNITGIIDWEFASTETKAVAFSSPCMLWPVGDFYAGNNELSPDELEFASVFERRGRTYMADIVRDGRKMQRMLFFNGGGVSCERDEFEALFQGLRGSWAEETKEQISDYKTWKEAALQEFAQDEGLQQVLRRSSASA